MPVVLCKCEISSLKLRKKHRTRLLENRVVTNIYYIWPKSDEVTWQRGRLRKEELHEWYSSHQEESHGTGTFTYGSENRCTQNFCWETYGKIPLDELYVAGRKI